MSTELASPNSRWRVRRPDYRSPVGGGRPAANNVLIYLKNQTAASVQASASNALSTMREIGRDFIPPNTTICIDGNDDAEQLMQDYDWVISLAKNLQQGLEINENNPSIDNNDITETPIDRDWVRHRIELNFGREIFTLQPSQKEAIDSKLDWATIWGAMRYRM